MGGEWFLYPGLAILKGAHTPGTEERRADPRCAPFLQKFYEFVTKTRQICLFFDSKPLCKQMGEESLITVYLVLKMDNQSNLDDRQLIKLVKKGNTKALEEIVEKYELKVFNLAMKFLHNQEDAEEVAQDVFLTLFHKAKSFQGKSAFSSWLYRIVVNAAFMKLRKKKQELAFLWDDVSLNLKKDWVERDLSYKSKSDSRILTAELYGILNDAIKKLPNRYRSVFILRDVNGLSNQEASEVLSLSLPAVKSRLHRSRVMLQKKLSSSYVEFVGILPPEEEATA